MKIMKRNAIIVISGILLNVFGSFLAYNFNLPFWFDMTGTCIATYYTGVWGGIVAGIFNNVVLGFYDPKLCWYALTGVVSAVVMNGFIKKGYLENLFKAVISSFWLGILCTIVSTPLNFMVYNGYSGNMWADILVDMLKWYGVPSVPAALAGEAIVEILDRQICVLLSYVIIHLLRRLKTEIADKAKTLMYVFVIVIGVCFVIQPFKMVKEVYEIGSGSRLWEEVWYKNYLIAVVFELILFTIISIISMFLFAMRKNELERMQIDLKKTVIEQIEELETQQRKTKALFVQTTAALSEAVDAKDRYTSGHSKRVAEYAQMIAARMGKSKEEQEEIYRAGLLHDVGKIRIPREIINKTGKLTEEEYNTIKIHPVTGYHILKGIPDSKLIALGAKYHHERYDGTGYPIGLVGDKIPEVARILGVVDAYDAMTSNRSYREALAQDVVRSEIEKGKGTQFDPNIADIMLQMIDEDKDYILKQQDSLHRTVLIVDDEPMNCKLVAGIMRDEPMYEIFSANSGKDALELMEQQEFDLILLDVRMPEMDGMETFKRIREKYQTPIAFITGDKSMDTYNEFAALGCDEFITKPFPPLLLKEVVHNLTERTVIAE